MRQRPDVPGIALLLNLLTALHVATFADSASLAGAVSERARRRDRRMSRRRAPHRGTQEGDACAPRLGNHRGASAATVRSRHAHPLSCSRARAPVTTKCARVTSGAPRGDLPHGPVDPRHDCVAQRCLVACVHPRDTGSRGRKRQGRCARSATCNPSPPYPNPGSSKCWSPGGSRGDGMRTRAGWFTGLVGLVAVLLAAAGADAASVGRQCRRACTDEIASCVAAGGRRLTCTRQTLMRCRREGLGVCLGAAAPVTLVGGCTSPTVIPAQGGTFTGTTSGTNLLTGSCGSSETSPEKVFQWTPTVSGTATIQTCGAGTSFDTVLYMRSGVCASGPEVAAGCNDDACPNSTGLYRASRITPSVTAGKTYFIVVDGYSGAQGNFILTVTPPGGSTTTTLPALTTTTTRPATATTTTTTRASTSSTTTTLPPPTNLTATAPSCSEVDLRWTRSTGSVSGYNVYRKASTDATFTMIKQVGASPVFPVADTAASGAPAYTYGVTAWNSAGSSAMPRVLTNTPACPTSVNPTLVGYVPAVGIAKDVAVDSTRGVAYVASTEFGISTVNVSNPSNPVAIGGAIPPFDGEELAVSGSLGVAPVAGVGMEVFDLSSPPAPPLVGSGSAPVIHVAPAGQAAS